MSDEDIDSLLRNVGRAPPRPIDSRWIDDGRYELGRVLGEGAFGVVYETFDRLRAETVALKLLRRASSEALLRFKREFRVLSRISDPSFVRLYELHGSGDRWYFTMERVDGVPFDVWVRDPYRLRPGFESLFGVLERLHAHGLVHRDLKPSNVLVDRAGRVVLLDFGLTHALEDGGSTAMGGTPAYVAPEIAAGEAPSPASDWYAVGVMLYEALTGELPFRGGAAAVVREKQTRAPVPVLERAPSAPADLARICDVLLRTRPEERTIEIPRRALRRSPFIGRGRELEALSAALDASRVRRTPVVVRVTGASGAGKSSLLHHFVTLARAGDVHVLVGRCHPNAHVPFVALDGIVDDLARMLVRMPPSIARALAPREMNALVSAFPVLQTVPGFSLPSAPEGHGGSRSQLGAALRDLLQRIGEPWLLVIDDAQWGDADSAAVLAELLDDLAGCLVLVQRSDANDPFAAISGQEIAVGAMGDSDVRALARENGVLVDGDLEAIVSDSGGHPLFVVEMARDRAAGGPRRALRDIVMGRFEGLSVEARAAATILAIVNAPIETAVLRHIGVAASAIDELLGRGIVTFHDAESVRIYHDRVREVIASTVTTEQARAVHRGVADALLATFPDRAEVLAFHFERSGDELEAMRQLVRAARHATATRAFARARTLYGEILRLRERTKVEDGLELELRVERAEACARAGMSVEAAEAFLASSRLAPEGQALMLRLRAAEQLVTSGHLARGEKILDEQLRHLGLSTPASVPGRLLGVARDTIGKRADRWRGQPASEARLAALWSACRVALSLNPVRAVALGATLVREAARPGASAYARMTATFVDAVSLVGSRGPEGVPQALSRIALAAGDRSDPKLEVLHAMGEGMVRYFGLEIAQSVEPLGRVARITHEHGLGLGFEETMARCMRSACGWILGNIDDLRDNVHALCAELEERDNLGGWVLVAMHRTWLTLMERGPGAEVDALLEDVRRRWGGRGLDLQGWWLDIAKVHIALIRGDGRTAWRLSRMQARPYRELIFATLMHRLEAQTFLVRGAIRIGMRDPGSDEVKAAHRVVSGLSRVPSTWTRAHALCLDAGLRSIAGDRDATVRALRAAIPALEDAKMPLMLTLARYALGRSIGGDEGMSLVQASDEKLRAWEIDREVALACTLPGAW